MLMPFFLQKKLAQIRPMANALELRFRKLHVYKNKYADKSKLFANLTSPLKKIENKWWLKATSFVWS